MMGYWHDMGGWDYVWMIGMMALWVAILIGVAWGAVVLLRNGRGPSRERSAKEELDRRLARGEITEDEYRSRRDLIRSG